MLVTTFRDESKNPLTDEERAALAEVLVDPKAAQAMIANAGMAEVQRLTISAFDRLTRNLTAFGNVLSEDHREALMEIVGSYSLLASGHRVGRYAFDLDTGMGKTQSVVAWLAEVHAQGLPYSVAVCASKVEALCDLKRDLIRQGVPAEKIGLWHSYGFDPTKADDARLGRSTGLASLPATGNYNAAEFLLVTHNRLRSSDAGLTERLKYRGEDRSLVIWDESLLVSEHRTIRHADILSSLGGLTPQVEAMADGSDAKTARLTALRFADECGRVLSSELARQRKSKGAKPKTVRLPDLSPERLDAYRKSLMGTPRWNLYGDALATLFDFVGSEVRVLDRVDGGGAHVTFSIAVPPSLNRLVVLDASWPIRELEKIDPTISAKPQFKGRVKHYDNVTLRFAKTGAGRRSIEASMAKERADERDYCREVAAILAEVPEGEAALVFTFKTKGSGQNVVKIEDILRRDLRAAGIDLDQTVTVNGEDKPRFVILTWGNETSLSSFSYCSYVVFAGVLQRSDSDLAGAIVGQRDDYLAMVTQDDIETVKRSEVVHCVYQAVSRSACRVVTNGYAGKTTIHLAHHDHRVLDLLETAMPGLVVEDWKPRFLKTERPEKVEAVAKRIVAYLDSLPANVSEVSAKTIKKAIGLTDAEAMTFKRARDRVVQRRAWRVVGRSFVRLFPAA
jgi:hypothetical protein